MVDFCIDNCGMVNSRFSAVLVLFGISNDINCCFPIDSFIVYIGLYFVTLLRGECVRVITTSNRAFGVCKKGVTKL